MYDKLKDDERQALEIDFGNNPDKFRREYLDMCEVVQLEVLHTTRFYESSDLSTKYLGKTDMTKETKIKAEGKFAISEQGYTLGKLLNDTECKYYWTM